MIKSRLKTLVALTLLVGVVAGLGIYYSSVAADLGMSPSALPRHDCPVYPYSEQLALSAVTDETSNPLPSTGNGEEMPGSALLCPDPSNIIDNEVNCKILAVGATPAPPSSDFEFVRRIYVDLTGRIPTSTQVRAFLANPNRTALIDQLLNSPEFVDKMTNFFDEMFKNTGRRLYGPGRNQFHRYIQQSVRELVRASNPKPYSQFVTEMLLASGESATNGPVNYLLRAWIAGANQADFRDDAWVQVGQHFLGQTFACISCHSGAGHLEEINLGLASRTRMQLWEMAGFFGQLQWRNDRQNVMYRLEEISAPGYTAAGGGYRPGRTIPAPGVVTPQYRASDGQVTRSDFESNFREDLVRGVLNDPQFSRATVNHLMSDLMGRGIVDPPFGFDMARQDPNNPPTVAPWTGQIQPSHPALLNQLATDFRANNYNLRRTIRLIVTSKAYQRSAEYTGAWQDSWNNLYARRPLRRFTAEQLHDAVTVASGVMPTPAMYNTGMGYNVNFAVQTQSMEIIGGGAGNILGIFEAGNRDDVDRLSRGSIRQSIFLMNDSGFMRVRMSNGQNNGNIVRRLVATSLSPAEIADEIYLSVLSRYPTPAERDAAVTKITANRVTGTEDVAWVAFNYLGAIFY